VSIRTDDKIEVIDEGALVLLPIRAPNISIVDLDQALGGHFAQIGIQDIRMRDNDRFSGGQQAVQGQSCLV
jgi:hypothetical protein